MIAIDTNRMATGEQILNERTANYMLGLFPKAGESEKIKKAIRKAVKNVEINVSSDIAMIELGRFDFPIAGREFLVNRIKKLASETSKFTITLDSLTIKYDRLVASSRVLDALVGLRENIDALNLVDEIKFETGFLAVLTDRIRASNNDWVRLWMTLQNVSFAYSFTAHYLYLVEYTDDGMSYVQFKVGSDSEPYFSN